MWALCLVFFADLFKQLVKASAPGNNLTDNSKLNRDGSQLQTIDDQSLSLILSKGGN